MSESVRNPSSPAEGDSTSEPSADGVQPRAANAALARSTRRVLLWACLVAGVPGLIIVALTISSVLATDLERVNAKYAPFEQVSGQKPLPQGACGLNQLASGSGCQPAVAASLKQEEVKYASSMPEKGVPELIGELTLPQGIAGKRPAVILIHGSGPADRHLTIPGCLVRKLPEPFALFDALGQWLAQQGFVVLSYDKRSCGRCYGASSFDPQRFSFQDFETDAIDGLKYLKTRPEVHPEALVVLGASQGGGFAPFVAKAVPGVSAVVSLAGLFEGFGTALLSQLDRISAVRKDQWDYFGPLNVYFQKAKFENCLTKLSGAGYQPDEVCLGGGVTQRALKDYEERSKTGEAELLSLSLPTFLAQGTLDRNVSPEQFISFKDKFAARNAQVHYIAGMDHSQTDAFAPANAVHPVLLERLKAFFSAVPMPAAQ